MSKIKIITDSASDISVADEKNYDIHVVPFTIAIDDQVYTARKDFDNEKFYQMMDQYDEIPKTSQITAFRFVEAYKELFDQGYTDLICILINSEGSATYGNSKMAIDMLYEEYPECEGKINITCHDGQGYSGMYGQVAVEAADMVKKGASAEEVNHYVASTIPKRRIYFGIYNLKYAGKSGRIPSAAAFIGDKLGIKPVMKIWDHEITTADKCRGEKKVLAKLIDHAKKEMKEGSPYQIIYGNDSALCQELVERCEKELGYKPNNIYQIGAEVAANAGPKVSGIIIDVK